MVGGGGWWRQWVVAAVSEGGMETKKNTYSWVLVLEQNHRR